MKLLTRDSDYAVRALCYVAANRERVIAVDELVLRLAVARPFLRSILQRLAKAGFLRTSRGRNGGFTLCVNAGRISVLDVLGVFQKNFTLLDCRTSKLPCHNLKRCPLRKEIQSMSQDITRRLSKITIEGLVKAGYDASVTLKGGTNHG